MVLQKYIKILQLCDYIGGQHLNNFAYLTASLFSLVFQSRTLKQYIVCQCVWKIIIYYGWPRSYIYKHIIYLKNTSTGMSKCDDRFQQQARLTRLVCICTGYQETFNDNKFFKWPGGIESINMFDSFSDEPQMCFIVSMTKDDNSPCSDIIHSKYYTRGGKKLAKQKITGKRRADSIHLLLSQHSASSS